MEMPENTTLIVIDGSFNGTPPDSFEIGGSAQINGVATGSSVTFLDGATLIDGSSLTLTDGSLVASNATINGALTLVNVTPAVSGSLAIGGSLSYNSSTLWKIPALTTTSGASITLVGGACLSVTTSATIGATTLNGSGYLATPHGVDTAGFTQGTDANIRVCEYGAGIFATALLNTTKETATLTVTRTDNSVPYLIEKRLGSASSYTTVDLTCDDSSSVIDTTFGQTNVVRVFDGNNFFSDVAYVIDVVATEQSQSGYYAYTLECYGFSGSVTPFRFEPVVFLGQVQNKDTGNLIKRSEVSGVSLTMYAYDSYTYGSSSVNVISSWTNIPLDTKCFFETEKTLDMWSGDDGCNFCWIPNQNTETFVSSNGKYLASFKVTLLSGTVETFSLTFEVL